jgi:hypothetical protein
LEHLPLECVGFVLKEIARVTAPNGLLVASSPNQVSLDNRLRLLRGHSILEMPDEKDYARGTFGHIRLYTIDEFASQMRERHNFSIHGNALESNNSGYHGRGAKRLLYRIYESLEFLLPSSTGLADTWYIVMQKNRT